VKAEQLKTASLPVADLLLNRVMDEGIDLLVTGAYSHNAKGDPVPGPVARQLLRTMTVPVLMAH
jgi:nucleotide-binding universal stress UspA family protein